MLGALRLVALTLADAAGLMWSTHAATPAVHYLESALRRPPQVDELVSAVATGLLVLVCWYVALVLLACALARLPGLAGHVGRRTCAAIVPAAVRRVLVAATGVSVVVAPAACGAIHATAKPPHPPAAVLPAPAWPTDASAPGSSPPSCQPPASRQSGQAPSAGHPARAPAQPSGQIEVRPGDSLWRIAARSLAGAASPQRVAVEWPRWWAANRAVIGADPDLVRPGQLLTPPVSTVKRSAS